MLNLLLLLSLAKVPECQCGASKEPVAAPEPQVADKSAESLKKEIVHIELRYPQNVL